MAPLVGWDLGSFSPFVKAGMGWARHDHGRGNVYTAAGAFQSTVDGATVDRFAWSVGAGLGYALTERIHLEAAYQYLDAGTVGLRYDF